MKRLNTRIFGFQYAILLFLLFHLILVPQVHAQENDLEKAKTLNRQVIELYQQGRYADAIPIAKNVLTIVEKALGPDHPGVATGLNNLAGLYESLGDYAKAEPLYKRAFAITEKAFGPDDPRVANSLNNLALLYESLGDYAKAEPLYQRALAIDEKAHGSDHPDVANSLNNLALLYESLGDYAKAEPLYKRALAITEKAFGPDDPRVATTLGNLAGLYRSLGDYGKAESLYRRAQAIKEKALGPDHPDVATTLNNRAVLYHNLGNYAKAGPLLRHALAIQEKALGPDHPDVAASVNNLALLYADSGDYFMAEPLYKLALAIREKALGPDHPDVAASANNLAGLYYDLGNYSQAEPLYKRALAIVEKAYGSDHPKVATTLDNLATLYAALDDYEKAHKLAKEAIEINSKLIEQVMGFTSENQKMQFLALKKGDLEGFLTLIDRHLIQDPGARKDALNTWLRRKGVILEAQRRFQEALVYSDDPESVKTFQELARVRAQLSALAFGGPGKEGVQVYKKRLADLEAQKEQLQAKLSKLSQAFSVSQKVARADSETVAQTLPKNSVLLEFARIDMFNFKAKGKEKKWQPAHYLAFVLHAGRGDQVGMIDLGDAKTIDNAVAQFKRELSDLRDLKGKKASKTSKNIYKLVFAPLKKELRNVKQIFISPDGNLNLIPFEVLQGPDGRYLIEDYSFNYLAAGRDLVGFGAIKASGDKAVIIGDPDFDLGAAQKAAALRKLALGTNKDKQAARRSMDMRGLHFQRLPGTRKEAEVIWSLIGKDKCELFLDQRALEEVLEQKRTPSILHLATHGFFLSDMDFAGLVDDTMARGVMGIKELSKPTGKKFRVENPLLRSGIALAGANSALMTGDFASTGGIVTAEKILGLRLRGTDLVVLSACDTGLGEVQSGEGVFGLRRAFTQAGTRSLVMSMWSVPDKETKELMVAFYKNIIKGGMDRCQALRKAALRQMQIVKKRYGSAHPAFWGGFIFMGQPG